MLPAETDLNTLPLLSGIPEKVIPASTGASEGFFFFYPSSVKG